METGQKQYYSFGVLSSKLNYSLCFVKKKKKERNEILTVMLGKVLGEKVLSWQADRGAEAAQGLQKHSYIIT